MTTASDLHAVTGWLADLANMTSGSMPLADSKPKIVTMASMLVTKFPIEAFCRKSLDHVAAECRFFPPYADVIKHLGGWWRDHRPEQPAIAGTPPTSWRERYNIPEPREAPTEAEMAAVAEIVRSWKMEVASSHPQPGATR